MITDFRIKVFHTVALKKNFTKAAKELQITQPAVSKHIFELEQEIGDLIFTRERGSVNLTPKGEVLFSYSTKILDLYDRLNREIVPGCTDITGELHICAYGIAARYLLPPIVSSFTKVYPGIKVSLIERSDEEIAHLLKERLIDLGIVSKQIPGTKSDFFAKITLNNPEKPLFSLYFAYSADTENIGIISKFILSANTYK